MDYAAKLALFLFEDTGSIFGCSDSKMTASEQRKLFGCLVVMLGVEILLLTVKMRLSVIGFMVVVVTMIAIPSSGLNLVINI